MIRLTIQGISHRRLPPDRAKFAAEESLDLLMLVKIRNEVPILFADAHSHCLSQQQKHH